MPILNGLPSDLYFSTTGFNASALMGCTGLPSSILGILGFICAQISFETVIPLPFKSIENGVMI